MPFSDSRLLTAGEPSPVRVVNRRGRSPFVIAVDHASHRIPRRLGDLGLSAEALRQHIAWDIGSLAVARHTARILDAVLLAQTYSRLVIDCNRPPASETSIPTFGEETPIPGNCDLDTAAMAARRREIFDPYHARLQRCLDRRQAAGLPTILVAQHSMTPIFKGEARPMHAAVMYNRDRRLAGLVLDALGREPELVIADNAPYFVTDAGDYTIPVHGEGRGLPHVAIEIRQDLLLDAAGQRRWGERIAAALLAAVEADPALLRK